VKPVQLLGQLAMIHQVGRWLRGSALFDQEVMSRRPGIVQR
jgi:hypothetical protein